MAIQQPEPRVSVTAMSGGQGTGQDANSSRRGGVYDVDQTGRGPLQIRNPSMPAVAQSAAPQAAQATNISGATNTYQAGAQGRGYDATTGRVDDNQLASFRASDIMSSDHPLMMLARVTGRERANAMGGLNSSIESGQIARAMADYAVPMAGQEAETFSRQSLTNQQAQNEAAQFGSNAQNVAELERQRIDAATADANTAREQEARRSNQAAEQQTLLENADWRNAATARNEEAVNRARAQTQEQDHVRILQHEDQLHEAAMSRQDYEQDRGLQELATSGALDLAETEGYYKQIISQNDTAARIYADYQGTVQGILGNENIFGDEAAEKIEYARNVAVSGLEALSLLNQIDLSDLSLPTATGSGYKRKHANLQSGFEGGLISPPSTAAAPDPVKTPRPTAPTPPVTPLVDLSRFTRSAPGGGQSAAPATTIKTPALSGGVGGPRIGGQLR